MQFRIIRFSLRDTFEHKHGETYAPIQHTHLHSHLYTHTNFGIPVESKKHTPELIQYICVFISIKQKFQPFSNKIKTRKTKSHSTCI